MSIKAFEGGKVQLFDKDTGDFLSLGKVYVYEPGTTTLKSSYTTSALTVANANPVILDAYGRAEIWVSGNAKFLVQDANGGSEYEVDNYNRDSSDSVSGYNLAENGSFEDDAESDGTPDNWTLTLYTGGTKLLDTTVSSHGAQSLKFTSTGSGGGYATQTNFQQVGADKVYLVRFKLNSSVADVRNLVLVKWYDLDEVFISNTTVYDDSATNPTTFTTKQAVVTAPATAAFAKLELYGCHSSDATAGSTWFDEVEFTNAVLIDADNTFTGANTFTGSRTISSTDAGAAVGPNDLNYRNSASPAAADEIGTYDFQGEDSAGNTETYARIGATIVDPTSTSEDSQAYLSTEVAGTLAKRIIVGQGVYSPNATSGDKGIDTANFSAIYDDGAQIFTNGLVLLSTQTASASATLDFTSVITNTYDEYILSIDKLIPATDAVALWLRVSTDNGSTYSSAASYGYTGASSQTQFVLATGVQNTAAVGLCGNIHLFSPSDAANLIGQSLLSWSDSATSLMIGSHKSLRYQVSQDTDAVRLMFSSGNITSGVARLYGVKKS